MESSHLHPVMQRLVAHEVPDPGAGPDRSRCCRCSPGMPEDAPTTTSGTAPPPCSPRWRSPPGKVTGACKPRHRTRSSWRSSSTSPRPTPTELELHLVMDNYATHKHAERQGLAGQATPGSTCTSPRPTRLLAEPGRGLVRHHRTPSHPPRHLHLASRTSSPRSAPSSTAGTTAATPSSGPRPPTRSSRKANRKQLQTRDTSSTESLFDMCRAGIASTTLMPSKRPSRVASMSSSTCMIGNSSSRSTSILGESPSTSVPMLCCPGHTAHLRSRSLGRRYQTTLPSSDTG